MKVADLLRVKGADVATISKDRSIADAVTMLKERRIGALVVTSVGTPLVGMFSERDVVRAVAQHGTGALAMPVESFMSNDVFSCRLTTTLDNLMALMTQQRIRHVPVVEDDQMVGLVSIGDVVRGRLEELEKEKMDLLEYVNAR